MSHNMACMVKYFIFYQYSMLHYSHCMSIKSSIIPIIGLESALLLFVWVKYCCWSSIDFAFDNLALTAGDVAQSQQLIHFFHNDGQSLSVVAIVMSLFVSHSIKIKGCSPIFKVDTFF
jgi:hypothetical protein